MSSKKLTKRSLTSEMERNVKQMLKLIEENGDSFAQKAEMYYQKRPELISLVEEFYRGYRSLAERYEHVTCDLQSQVSCVSDNGPEPPSTWPSPRKVPRRVSTNRAAGFDFFLGSGGNDASSCQKDGDGSSTLTDSDDEYDDASSINSFSGFFGNGNDHNNMNRRVLELEIELREMKEKLNNMHEEDGSSSCRGTRVEDFGAKVKAYEEKLRKVNEKLRLSEGEIGKLRIEVERYRSMESENFKGGFELSTIEEERMTKEKLEASEMQIASLRFEAKKSCEDVKQLKDQLEMAQKDIANWKTKFNSEKRERLKLQERLARLKTSLADKEHEVRDLKSALSDAEQKIFFERANMKSEMTKLLGEHTHLEEEVKKIQSTFKGEIEMLKEDIEDKKNNIKDLNVRLDAMKLEKENLNEQVGSLKEVINFGDNQIEEAHKPVEELRSRIKELEEENEKQRVEILEGAEEKREAIRQLCFSLEHYRNGYIVLRQAFTGHKRLPVLAT